MCPLYLQSVFASLQVALCNLIQKASFLNDRLRTTGFQVEVTSRSLDSRTSSCSWKHRIHSCDIIVNILNCETLHVKHGRTCLILHACVLWVVSTLPSRQTWHSCWSSRSSVLTIGEGEQSNASCRGTLMRPPSKTSRALLTPPLCLISPPVYFLGYVGWNVAITNQRLWIFSRKKQDYT